MKDSLSDMLKFGINLKLSGKAESLYYVERLKFHLMSLENIDCENVNEETLEVYYLSEKALRVKVSNSILKFEPLIEDSFEALMAVLDFVANMHQITQEDFRKLNRIPDPLPKQIEDESEESSSDDFEWI